MLRTARHAALPGLIFTKQDWIDEIGEFLPIHFGVDDDWTWRAAIHGHRCVYRSAMAFTHHHITIGSSGVINAAREHHALALERAATYTLPGSDIAALKGPVRV